MSEWAWMLVLFAVLTFAAFRFLHVMTKPAGTARFWSVLVSVVGSGTFLLWYEGPGAWRGALFGVWAGAALSSLALANFSAATRTKRWLLLGVGASLVACGVLLLEPQSRTFSLLLVGLLVAGAAVVLLLSGAVTLRLLRTALNTQRTKA